MKTLFTIASVLFISASAFAQRSPNWCMTDQRLQKYLDENDLHEEFIQWREDAHNNAREWLLRNKNTKVVRSIPVVIHILYKDAAENISDQAVIDMLEEATLDFRRQNADAGDTRPVFTGVATDAQIEFCLATKDPNGDPHSGITRTQTTLDDFPVMGNEAYYTASGGLDAWDPTKYLNIWVCDIYQDSPLSFVAGWASMPVGAGGPTDGIVVDYEHGLTETLTHEAGHYLGLDHVWGPQELCTNDDGFTDTPNSASQNIDVTACNFIPEPNTCDDGAGDLPDQYENFMTYSACRNMFTIEQAAFMNGVLDNERNSVITSGNCDPTLTADFIGDPDTIYAGEYVQFTDLSSGGTVTSWSWSFQNAATTTSSLQNPNIQYFTLGSHTVSLTVSDGTNSDTETKDLYITVLPPPVLTANFEADLTTIIAGDSINFFDLSVSGIPNTWSWSFQGGTPASSTVENPTNIKYLTAGNYNVTLTVSDATTTDSEIKTAYIHVLPVGSLLAGFSASETVIIEGDTISFTDMSSGYIDSWSWSFSGASPSSSSDQNPDTIIYNAAGSYDVQLIVCQDTVCDTLLIEGYITVMPAGSVSPEADFYAPFSSIPVNTSATFVDLSTGNPTTWKWIFESGSPYASFDQDPGTILYADTGYYDVTLIVTNPLGKDTLVKEDYIYVYDPASVNSAPVVDFTTLPRLFMMGGIINYTDLSANEPTSWTWIFEGGTPAASAEQNPAGITYNIPGLYDVTLIVSNAYGTDSLTKTEYIVVSDTTWADTMGYCDTISNFTGYTHTFYHLDFTWGYFPGHNGESVKAYADKFVNWTFSEIHAAIIPVKKTVPGATDGYIRVKVWEGDTYPETEVTSTKVELADLYPNTFCQVNFDSVIPVNGRFFVGYELRYNSSAQDTFVCSMVPDRGASGLNTLYVKKSSTWYTPHEFSEYIEEPDLNIYTSLGIEIIGCLVGIDETEFDPETEILLYPNPSKDIVNVNLGGLNPHNVDFYVFDLTGRLIPVNRIKVAENHYELDFSDRPNGFYFVNIRLDNGMVTRKVSVIR